MTDRPEPLAASPQLDRDIRRLYTLWGIIGAAILPFFTVLLASRGLRADRIGLIVAASSLAGVLATPLWSHEADTRLGTTRTLFLASLAPAIFALTLIPAGGNPWLVGALAAAMGAAGAPVVALADTLALHILGPGRAADFGRIRRFASAGWAIAVVAFGALYERVGLWPVLPAYAAGSVVYAWLVSRFPDERPEPHPARRSRLSSAADAFRSSQHLLPFLAGLLLLSIATSATDSFIPLRMLGVGGGPFLIGLAAGAAAVIEIPIFTASSRLGERFGMRNLFLAGTAISIVTLLGYGVAGSPAAVAVFRGLSGAAFGLKYAALVVLIDRLVPAHLRTTGQGLLQMASMGIGPILGPAVGGFVYVHLGPPTLFVGAAVAATGAAIIAWWALRGLHDAGGTQASV